MGSNRFICSTTPQQNLDRHLQYTVPSDFRIDVSSGRHEVNAAVIARLILAWVLLNGPVVVAMSCFENATRLP